MKLSKSSVSLLAAMSLTICFACAVLAQNKTAKSHKHGAKAAGTHRPTIAVAATPAPASPAAAKVDAGRRDPFTALISEHKTTAGPGNLPPGKAGLQISTVRVEGTVHSGDSMIAVLSNPEQHVYFAHEGDRLYDGDVEKIGIDGVTFKEDSKDAFGKPVERLVTKRIYASAGEQQ